MAVLWERSAIPWVDGDQAYSGAKAYFFDAGTTTPMITYTDAALSIPHDHPVVANSRGIFPAIFFADETVYKFRVLDSDDATIIEVDNVSAPTTEPPDFPESETPEQKLFQTGWIMMAWTIASQTGFVRMNGRTIGSAASGATERANADCEDLFEFLWDNDANLVVSGGRGSTSAGDWAANKTIALPDFRGRVPGGLDAMGSSAAGRITDAVLGSDSDTLGSAGGAETHTLTEAELAEHLHTVNITDPGHRHFTVADTNGNSAVTSGNQIVDDGAVGGDSNRYYFLAGSSTDATIGRTSSGTTGITAAAENKGSGDPHANLQPTILITFFIKL